jgi:hypothetical protein
MVPCAVQMSSGSESASHKNCSSMIERGHHSVGTSFLESVDVPKWANNNGCCYMMELMFHRVNGIHSDEPKLTVSFGVSR